MKQSTLYLSLLLLGLFMVSSCNEREDTHGFAMIKELSKQYPDSALFLLDASFYPETMDDKSLSEWCILNGALRDTLHKEVEIDTFLLQRAVAYYQKRELFVLQAKAELYLGRAFVHQKNYNSATLVYLSALESARKSRDYNLQGYISSYFADLCMVEWNSEEAIKRYSQASVYFRWANNLRSYAIALRDMGRVYVIEEKEKVGLALFEKADSIGHVLNDSLLMASMANSKGVAYSELKEYGLAKQYLLKSIDLNPLVFFNTYLALTDLYVMLGAADSATFYLEECNRNLDIYEKKYYFDKKYKISKLLGETDCALEYLEQYSAYNDSIWDMENSIYVSEIAKKYDYSKVADENTILRGRLHIRLMWIFLLAFVSLLIYMIYNRIVSKKNNEIKHRQMELDAKELIEQKRDIKLKEQSLELEQNNLIVRKQDLLLEEQALQLRNKQQALEQLKSKEYLAKQNLLKRSLLFKKVRMLSELRTSNPKAFKDEVESILSSSSLSESDWKEIKEEMNYVYSDFTNTLLKMIPNLVEEEVHFCCLLKLGLDTNELAVLLDINTTSVDRRRTRLNKKIREVYPDASWSDFLENIG